MPRVIFFIVMYGVVNIDKSNSKRERTSLANGSGQSVLSEFFGLYLKNNIHRCDLKDCNLDPLVIKTYGAIIFRTCKLMLTNVKNIKSNGLSNLFIIEHQKFLKNRSFYGIKLNVLTLEVYKYAKL